MFSFFRFYKMKPSNVILIVSYLGCAVWAQVPQRFTAQNPCTSKSTCQECIQTPSCAWCYDPVRLNSFRMYYLSWFIIYYCCWEMELNNILFDRYLQIRVLTTFASKRKNLDTIYNYIKYNYQVIFKVFYSRSSYIMKF